MRDEDLGIVVWINQDALDRPHKRLMETLTSRYSNNPIAFPLRSLQLTLPNYTMATEENIHTEILTATESSPMIVPVHIAREHLGWTEYYMSAPEHTEEEEETK